MSTTPFDKFIELKNREDNLKDLRDLVKAKEPYFREANITSQLYLYFLIFNLFMVLIYHISPYFFVDHINTLLAESNSFYANRWGEITQLNFLDSNNSTNFLSYHSSIKDIILKMEHFAFSEKVFFYLQNIAGFCYLSFSIFFINKILHIKKFFSNFDSIFLFNLFLVIFTFFYICRGVFLFFDDSFDLVNFCKSTIVFILLFMPFYLCSFCYLKKIKLNIIGENKNLNFKFKVSDYDNLETLIKKIKKEKNNYFYNLINDKESLNKILNDAKKISYGDEKYPQYRAFFSAYNEHDENVKSFENAIKTFENKLIKLNKKQLRIRND